MSLSLALNTALSSLNVNQRSLSVLSQNIANANNPEYSRKVLTQDAVYLQGTGAGVQIRDISRRVDDYLIRSVRNQGSVYGRSEAVADYTDRLQTLLGRPGSQNSIYSYTQSFFNALQGLSQTPENASLRTTAIGVAQSMARETRSLASGIYDMQYAIDQDIKRSIDTVNTNLKDIYSLNATISSNKLLGRSVSELEDRRDTLLSQISDVIDIQTYTQSNGVLNVFTAGGFSLVDENVYELSYNPASSPEFFANGNATSPINIYRLNESGARTGSPSILVSSGIGASVATAITGGKLKGYLELRDKQLPDVLEKLDALAATVRDEINAVHNDGVAFPGANSYTGTRLLSGEDYSQWAGQVRIAVLDQAGKPIPSNYSDETSGLRPLLLDLSKLDTGNTEGYPSVQGIISQINQYYGVPQNKVTLGKLNDIGLVLNNTSIPGTTPQLDFDFQLDNLSGENSDLFVTNIQVLDDSNTDITDLTQDVPKVNLASTGTYVTTAGSDVVTVKTAAAHGFSDGDRVYLTPPSLDIDGIPADDLGGYFIISGVTTTGFNITVANPAESGASHDISGIQAQSSYYTSEAGTNARTKDAGTITANIASNTTSQYYTVKATVASVDANGTITSSVVTYRIDNLATNVKNYRYAARSATDDGTVVVPNTSRPAITAMLVDANGNELPIINNQYTTTQKGYLKLVAGNSTYSIAIDSLDSVEGGQPNASPEIDATGRGFSHYFELNNFFKSNRSDGVVDDTVGSAARLSISDAIAANVNLISLGRLSQTARPADSTLPPLYTYERNIGDNSVIAALAAFNTDIVGFPAAGDLGATNQTISAYAGQIISTTSSKATSNQGESDNAKLLLDGFKERSDGVRGVNLDEELANTIIYQNAYSASARIITVANQFFEALIDAVR